MKCQSVGINPLSRPGERFAHRWLASRCLVLWFSSRLKWERAVKQSSSNTTFITSLLNYCSDKILNIISSPSLVWRHAKSIQPVFPYAHSSYKYLFPMSFFLLPSTHQLGQLKSHVFYTVLCFHSCHILSGWVRLHRSSPQWQDCTVQAGFPADVPHWHSSTFRTPCCFQVPPLPSRLFSFCSLVLSQLQLPFHLSVLSTVSVHPEEGKTYFWAYTCEKVSHGVECVTPRWQFRDKMVAGFHSFIYCSKSLLNKCQAESSNLCRTCLKLNTIHTLPQQGDYKEFSFLDFFFIQV